MELDDDARRVANVRGHLMPGWANDELGALSVAIYRTVHASADWPSHPWYARTHIWEVMRPRGG